MTELPKISIITPSLNQGRFIEQSICSVLDQGYSNVEMIVIDGGSTDATLDLLKKFEPRIKWISETDTGQANAINRGIRMATGEILAYLNSDDYYLPGTFHLVGEYFRTNPDARWLSGYCRNIDRNGEEIRKGIKLYKNFWLKFASLKILKVLNFISQPATFWRRDILNDVGLLDEGLNYTMDYDLWLRIGRLHQLHILRSELACFRIHLSSKSGSTDHGQFDEELMVAGRYSNNWLQVLHQLHRLVTVNVYKHLPLLGESAGT